MNALTQRPSSQPDPNAMASVEDWACFLRPLLAAVRQPPSAEDFRIRIAAIAFALPNIPVSVLTEARQRDALARFAWWPAVADIAEWLAPAMAPKREFQTYCSLPAPVPEPRKERSPEEIAAVNAATQAFMAERNAVLATAPHSIKPAHLTGEDLARFRDNPVVRAAKALQAQRART